MKSIYLIKLSHGLTLSLCCLLGAYAQLQVNDRSEVAKPLHTEKGSVTPVFSIMARELGRENILNDFENARKRSKLNGNSKARPIDSTKTRVGGANRDWEFRVLGKLPESKGAERKLGDNLASSQSSGSSSSSSTNSFGQLVVYPSPTASSITVGADGTVDPYTGRVNVSIPLFNLRSRQLSVPISLSYSSMGSKVDETASWVGHGWTLNAGGAISRVMKSMPDEFLGVLGPNCLGCAQFSGFGYLNTKEKVNLSALENSVDFNLKQKAIEFSNFTSLDGFNHGFGTPEGWDTQPDEFYFNFGKYSGKFVFDQDGNINQIPYQNLRISKIIRNNQATGNIPKIVQFEVVTEDGTVYVFGDESLASVEESKLETTGLTSKYQYATDIPPLVLTNGLHIYKRIATLNRIIVNGNFLYDNFTLPGNSHLSTYSYFSSTWYLREIKTPNSDDKITLNYSDNGEISYVQSKSITVGLPNLTEGSVGNEAVYASFEDSNPNPGQLNEIYPMLQTFTYGVNEITLRSKRLSSITTDNGNSANFTANTSRGDLYGDKCLEEISIYGGGSFIKSFKFAYEETLAANSYDFFDLKAWEPTGLGMDADLHFVDQKYMLLGQPGNASAFAAKYSAIFLAERKRMYLKSVAETESTGVKLGPFTLFYDTQPLPRKFSFKKDKWGYHNANNSGATLSTIEYTPSFGGVTVPYYSFPVLGWDALDPLNGFENLYSGDGADQAGHLSLCQAGILKKIVFPTGGSKEFVYALNTNTSGMNLWGLRVSEIKEYPDDAIPSQFISTSYSYTGGKEVGEPFKFSFQLPIFFFDEDNVTFSSSPVNPTYLTKGNVVGYRTSTKFQTGLGKTVYTFKNPTNEPNIPGLAYLVGTSSQSLSSNNFPFPLDLDCDWRRGLLEKTEIFNQGNKCLSRVTNGYNTNPENFNNKYSYALTGSVSGDFFYGGFYHYLSSWVQPTTILTETYDQSDPGNDLKKVSTTQELEFTPIDPTGTTIALDLMPRRISKSLSIGEKLVSEFKYPLDYMSQPESSDLRTLAINDMKLKNINEPIERIDFLEQSAGGSAIRTVVGGTLSTFKLNLNTTTGLERPLLSESMNRKVGTGTSTYTWSSTSSGVFTWESASYRIKVNVHSYDVYGNPTFAVDDAGITGTFTWGNNNSLIESTTLNQGANQHQTSFTNELLVGVTRITDANERNADFVYDDYKRLSLEKDHDGNILSRYRYHYRTQAAGFTNLTVTNFSCNLTGQTVTLNSAESVPGASTYIWTFGDGTGVKTTVGVVDKVYSSPGVYAVTCVKENDEYATLVATGSITIYAPITSWSIEADGPTSYDVCNANDPSAGTLCLITNGTAANIVWEESFNGGSYYPMGSGQCMGVPLGFGSQGIVGGWTIRCTFTDSCGNVFTEYISLSNYASNPLCEFY